MLKNKKGFLITITLLIIAVMVVLQSHIHLQETVAKNQKPLRQK